MNKKHFALWFFFILVFFITKHSNALNQDSVMIQISVEIAEINNTKARELGITWLDEIKTGESAAAIPALFKVGDWQRLSAMTADLKFLQDRGLAKIMSKPKIATKTGTTARFLVGGSIPVIAPGVGGGKIEWKDYGIKIEIKPELVENKYITAYVFCEVSRLDWMNKVMEFPAISSRQAEANVILKSGETLAIAGLGETKKESKSKGIPLLMDIPLLGVVFARKLWIDTENTIMIFVTTKVLE